MINDTTRTFPRTLQEAASEQFPVNTTWFEEPEEKIGLYDIIFSIIAFCIYAGLAYYFCVG
jgi:hypothetical protein